jgi:multidrug efflux system membrane fusion protein
MNHRIIPILLSLAALPMGAVIGCRQSEEAKEAAKLPVFAFSYPVQREVTDYVEYPGRTAAVKGEDIKARVTGYLKEVHFTEGKEVKKDAPLFTIDPRPYQAQYDQAAAQVDLFQSQLKLARANYDRDVELFKRTKGAGVSKQQLDADVAAQEQAEAQLKATKASLEVYKLNLEFTTVKSPIDGEAGRFNVPEGNLVLQDSTLLTTVQSVDPMFVYFDMDMPTYRKFQRGRIRKGPDGKIPIFMQLQGELDYSRPGTVDFFNNLVNPATDTLLVRAKFPNPKNENGRELKPGMFVRVKMPISQPHDALLVIDSAITSIQGRKNLYIVDADNKVQQLPVDIGQLQSDGLRVVQGQGLNAKTRVIVGKLLQVRPKTLIEPVERAMPTYSGAAAVTGNPPQTPRQGDKETRRQGDKETGK